MNAQRSIKSLANLVKSTIMFILLLPIRLILISLMFGCAMIATVPLMYIEWLIFTPLYIIFDFESNALTGCLVGLCLHAFTTIMVILSIHDDEFKKESWDFMWNFKVPKGTPD